MKYLLILLITFSTSSYAYDVLSKIQNRKKILVGLDASGYLPFEMKDKKGRIVGFDVDLARMIAKEMGVKLEIRDTEWDGIIPALLTKKFDMIIGGMTITAPRNIKFNFSNPYVVVGQTLIVNKKHKGKVKSFKDLNNKKYKVSAIVASTAEQSIKRLMPKAKHLNYQNSQEASLESAQGRVDAFVSSKAFNSIFANSTGKGKVYFIDHLFTYEPLGIAVNRGDPDILNWLNNFLRQIKHDGRYDRIYKKWFESTSWLKQIR